MKSAYELSPAERREFEIQQEYYAETADRYDETHVSGSGEHDFALAMLIAYAKFSRSKSILDVGSGTGRALRRIKSEIPDVKLTGVEPSGELRRIGIHRFGLSESEIVDGNALDLQFSDGEFDVVCEFGALHHVKNPERFVDEMLRVAGKAIFISDINNFGTGSSLSRYIKQAIDAVGLWKIADLIKTRGKGYTVSEGDGLAYSYSVFNNYDLIQRRCSSVHIMNTVGKSTNHYRQASHVLLLGIK